MQLINRNITALFLLVLVLAPISYFCISEIRQQQIRAEMRERLEKESLHKLVLDAAAVRWYKPGREILVGNRLFDVKESRSLDNGHVEFTGIFDDEETRLVKQVQETRENENNNTDELASLFQLLTGADIPVHLSAIEPCTTPVSHAGYYNWNLPVIYKGLRTPPPQFGLQIS